MSKIPYSPGALRRRMMMSRGVSLFIIVEGKETDRWHYDQLARNSRTLKSKRWMIWDVEQFMRGHPSGHVSGKRAVLELHNETRLRGELTLRHRNRICATLFCVDADLDRVIGSVRRSDHLYYTQFSDAEADLVKYCNLHAIISTLTSIPESDARIVANSFGEYAQNLGLALIPIMSLHLVAHLLESEYKPKLPKPADFNSDYNPKCCDEAILAPQRARIVKSTGSTEQKFSAIEKELVEKLQNLAKTGRVLHFIKGKWVLHHLFHLINNYMSSEKRRKLAGGDSISAVARSTTRFPWRHVQRFDKKVVSVLGVDFTP